MKTFTYRWRGFLHTIHFNRRWPWFKHHQGICMCDINELLRDIRK